MADSLKFVRLICTSPKTLDSGHAVILHGVETHAKSRPRQGRRLATYTSMWPRIPLGIFAARTFSDGYSQVLRREQLHVEVSFRANRQQDVTVAARGENVSPV